MNAHELWTSEVSTERHVRSGRLRSPAVPTERTLARVCREPGATMRINTKLRDMNLNVPADERAIEGCR